MPNNIFEKLLDVGARIVAAGKILVEILGLKDDARGPLTRRYFRLPRLMVRLGPAQKVLHLTTVTKVGSALCAFEDIKGDCTRFWGSLQSSRFQLQIKDLSEFLFGEVLKHKGIIDGESSRES